MQKRSTQQVWKLLGIALATLAAIASLINGLLAWRAEWQLQSRLAAIRAAGDPASIADLEPPPIPDEENAAAILEHLHARLKNFEKEYGQFYNSPLGKQFEEAKSRGESATPEQIEAIRGILDRYPDVEQAIEEAADCDAFASRLDFSLDHTKFLQQLFDKQQTGRTAARFLVWRSEVLMDDDEHEQALERGIQVLQLARLYQHEPTLVAYLVTIAMRGIAAEQLYEALAAGPVSHNLHEALDEELARHDDPQLLVQALASERAVAADWIYAHLSGVNPVLAQMFGWPMKSYQVGVLDVMEEEMQLAGQPWHAVRSKFGTTTATSQSTGHGVLADSLIPAVKSGFQSHARSLAVSRALRIFNALRHFAEKNGREASGLEELKLPVEATIDPYSGEPLKLKYTDEGWIIYSVMENGVDDGGDFKKLKDYGVAPLKMRLTE